MQIASQRRIVPAQAVTSSAHLSVWLRQDSDRSSRPKGREPGRPRSQEGTLLRAAWTQRGGCAALLSGGSSSPISVSFAFHPTTTMPSSLFADGGVQGDALDEQRALQIALDQLSLLGLDGDENLCDGQEPRKKSVNMTECVPVPSSEHVAEIVGRQGACQGFRERVCPSRTQHPELLMFGSN